MFDAPPKGTTKRYGFTFGGVKKRLAPFAVV
jgi:hypothetical protein